MHGSATVEEDFEQHHPKLLCHIAGKSLDGDAYIFPGWKRKLCKVAFNILLNTDQLSGGSWALAASGLFSKIPSIYRKQVGFELVTATVGTGVAVKAHSKFYHAWDWIHGSSFTLIQYHPNLALLRKFTPNTAPFRAASLTVLSRGFQHDSPTVFVHGFETTAGYVNLYARDYQQFFNVIFRNGKVIKADQLAIMSAPNGQT